MIGLVPFGVFGLIGGGFALALILWARWLGGVYGAPRWVRPIGFAPGAVWLVLFAQAFIGLHRTIDATTTVTGDPADKARILANGIAAGLYVLFLSMGAFLVGAAVLLFLTWRYRWSRKPPTAETQPPYR